MAQYIIETRQPIKTYRGAPAVNHLDLRIPRGSIFGSSGPDGAGRDTTMKILLGLINRDSGSIRINGTELNNHNRISILRQVSSLVEVPSYYGNLTTYENLQISCTLRGLSYMEIDRVLSTVRLDGQKKRQATDHSLGMKQRLGLVNTPSGSPKLVLLDKPTNGLDLADVYGIRELIRSPPGQFETTVMVSDHLLAEMEQTTGRIGITSRGRPMFQDVLSILQTHSTRQTYLRTLDDTDAAVLLGENGGLPVLFRGNEDRVALLLKGDDAADGFCYSATDGIRLPFPPDHILARIFHILVNHGIDLYRAEGKRRNLEDIYSSIAKEAGL